MTCYSGFQERKKAIEHRRIHREGKIGTDKQIVKLKCRNQNLKCQFCSLQHTTGKYLWIHANLDGSTRRGNSCMTCYMLNIWKCSFYSCRGNDLKDFYQNNRTNKKNDFQSQLYVLLLHQCPDLLFKKAICCWII
jgi:hypothetical protein